MLLRVFKLLSSIVDTVSNNLVDMVIVAIMDPGLIKNVDLKVFWPLFWSNSHFCLSKTRHKAVSLEDFVLIDLISVVEWLSKTLELLDVSLSFSWSEST